MPLERSWVEAANAPDCPFPLNNLPYGVFSIGDGPKRCGVAIGNHVLDLTGLEADGHLRIGRASILNTGRWNDFMALGADAWEALRDKLKSLLGEGSGSQDTLSAYLGPLEGIDLHLPIEVAEFTDFYAGKHHATNVGTMFRGPENALPPNWLHIPIGYNGRASSVVVSGTEVRRPWGQLKGPNDAAPRFAPCARFDYELELGAIVGAPSSGPVSVAEADDMIFGYVLLNDWSARDIQAWEYQPLGPFQAKATASTISPWIVTKAALAPFRRTVPPSEKEQLDYLKEPHPTLYDIALSVDLERDGATTPLTRTNYAEMYYSSAQQLAHHTTSGCPMRVGDLLGSGTVSGPERENRGSLLELSWGGKEPYETHAGPRSFLEDGDTVAMSGAAQGDGFTIGFGACRGKVAPALDDPYVRA
ncbi:MAG: fumarylacetoacetase, partial [Pseudomonadota bacterium]